LDVVDFKYAFQRSKKIKIDNVAINIIGLDDLILLKKAAVNDRNKSRDQEDLTFLQRLKDKLQ